MSPNLEAFRCSDDRLGFSHWVSFMVLGLSNGFTDPKQHGGVIEVEITIVKMMMKYLMVIIHHCEDDDEFMVFPVSPFGDNPHQSSPCLFTMVCDPPPGDVAFFSRGTSNHFLHPSPDTMPHHTLGVPMCQTGRGVHARRGGLPAAAGTH